MNLVKMLNRSFWIMLTAVFVQQLVVASSSYWLTDFAQNLKEGHFIWWLLLAYLGSLMLPYVPGAIANHFQTKWGFESVQNFYQKTLQTFRGQVGLWNHEDTRTQKEALLIKEGPQFCQDMTAYMYDVLSISLNAFLNILVVVWLLDIEFLISYVGGLTFTFFILSWQNRQHEMQSRDVEEKKSQITRQLSSAWDHWVLNNTAFLSLWNETFETKNQKYLTALSGLSKYKEGGAIVLSLASFVPTLIATIVYASKNSGNTSELLSLTVLLPRMFMILGHTTSLIYLIRDFTIMKSRQSFLADVLNSSWNAHWDKRIREDKIEIKNQQGQALEGEVHLGLRGHWTIRGANGAGKSSWLMKLKEQMGETACYLPPKSALGVGEIAAGLSTGQRIKEQIRLVLERSQVQFILLDEWDANLDEHNRLEVLEILKTLSLECCVIDIRHR